MRTYDLSPFWRSSVGFDRVFDLASDRMNDSDDYPLYDIAIEVAGDDNQKIEKEAA